VTQFTLFDSSVRAPSSPTSEAAVFNRLVSLAAERTPGPGITLDQVGDADALARELQKPEPDPERINLFSIRLGLGPDDLGQ